MKTLLFAACTLAGLTALAQADAYECKGTETKAECHDRLKCRANEEVEDCQKRLRANAAQQQQNGGTSNDDRDGRDRAAENRGGGGDNGGGRSSDDGGYSRRNDDGGGGGGGYSSGGGGGGRGYHGKKTFGLGLELGEPTGLIGKYYLNPKAAIDFGVGYIYDHYYYGDGFHIYADYLFHPAVLATTPAVTIPFYIGPGLRFWQFDYCVNRVCDYGGSSIGIRMPVGIAFELNNVPLDFFVQAIPTLDFVGGDYYDRYGHRAHFGIDASVGLRFWLK